MGCCNDCLTCDIAFNVVMSLSRASTCGSYSRIKGVTPSREEASEEEDEGAPSPLLFRWHRNAVVAIIIAAIFTNNFTSIITNSSPLYAAV